MTVSRLRALGHVSCRRLPEHSSFLFSQRAQSALVLDLVRHLVLLGRCRALAVSLALSGRYRTANVLNGRVAVKAPASRPLVRQYRRRRRLSCRDVEVHTSRGHRLQVVQVGGAVLSNRMSDGFVMMSEDRGASSPGFQRRTPFAGEERHDQGPTLGSVEDKLLLVDVRRSNLEHATFLRHWESMRRHVVKAMGRNLIHFALRCSLLSHFRGVPEKGKIPMPESLNGVCPVVTSQRQNATASLDCGNVPRTRRCSGRQRPPTRERSSTPLACHVPNVDYRAFA